MCIRDRNYLVEIAYAGSRARHMLTKVNPNQAPPVLGVRSADVNRPFIGVSPQLRDVGQVSSIGFLNYNALLVKFQRRFANGFSFLNSYTYGQSMSLIHISEPTRLLSISYAVFCLK